MVTTLRRRSGERASVGRFWRAYAVAVVALRYPVLIAWMVAAAAATIFLPPMTPAATLGSLVTSGSGALRAEQDATSLFGLPLTSPVAAVQRDPRGLSQRVQVSAVRQALAVDLGRVAVPSLVAAVPVANTGGLFPGSREQSTTVITFLYFAPGTDTATQTGAGQLYAQRYLSGPGDHLAGVTGPVPAQVAQTTIISDYLPFVELATVLAIAVIVGLHFRSFRAPLATLFCAGLVYLVVIHVAGWTTHRLGAVPPPDLEPVLVVLVLGVTTDYCVFFVAGMRDRLAAGAPRLTAARHATAEFTPIIVAAGLVVAAGAASLTLAGLGQLRAFGPTLALAVLIAAAAAVTLAPALIAIGGNRLFRRQPEKPGRWPARLASSTPIALAAALVCVLVLLIAAAPVRGIRLGLPLIRGLPATSQPAQAEAAAAKGFAPGILAPTEVIVLGPDMARRLPALDRLQQELARTPGVAGVVGPANLPEAQPFARVVLAGSGNAARYAVISATDPLGPAAIDQVRVLRADLPGLARAAGLVGVRFEVGGQSALAADAVAAAETGLWRVGVCLVLAVLVLLAIFLRSRSAPVYLLGASVLALLAALGLTVWIFQVVLGYAGLVYYVPFAVTVLLVSLGSDYNLFVVGRIWEEAWRWPLHEAVARAVPRASRAITTAGLALAAGFAMLALVPLAQFREIAVAMVIGIVIDTFIVRSLLVPSLVVLSGRAGRAR